MHIGVNAWRLYGPRLGIGRYIEYLLASWNTCLTSSDRVTIYTHEALANDRLRLSERFTNRLVRPKWTSALWENLLLPRHTDGIDVLFCPSYTVPFTYGGPRVVVIHSVDEVQPGAQPWWYQFTWEQRYRFSVRQAERVITGDDSTKERIVRRYGAPEDKIDVIWLGVDEAFRPIDDEPLIRETRRRYVGADRPYILFAGGLSRRRNVPILIEAFSRVKHRARIPHVLLLLGPNRGHHPLEALAREFRVGDSMVHADIAFANHRDLVPVYNAADLYVLPSSSDGFSLTLAEAMACGTPAITVNRAALGAVAHGYAYTIDEPTVDALADAIEHVLSDSALRQTLRERELDRARLFSWDRTASRTLDVLRRVGQGPRR